MSDTRRNAGKAVQDRAMDDMPGGAHRDSGKKARTTKRAQVEQEINDWLEECNDSYYED